MAKSDGDFLDESNCPPSRLDENGRLDLIPLLPTLDFPPDPALEAEGWQRRFMADPDRVKEATQLYTEMGFEIRIEAIQPTELHELCGSCRLATCSAYVTIYTRKQP